jgi:hypothetical protein
MKKISLIATAMFALLLSLTTGCETFGPAKTTLDAMPQSLGPLSLSVTTTESNTGGVHTVTYQRLESKEFAQKELRMLDLKRRSAGNNGSRALYPWEQPGWQPNGGGFNTGGNYNNGDGVVTRYGEGPAWRR